MGEEEEEVLSKSQSSCVWLSRYYRLVAVFYSSHKKHSSSEIEQLRGQLSSVRDSESSEVERLRRELKEALDQLAEYRQRQERLERAIKPQLAKTHHVLKKAKANLVASQPQPQQP